ncbi:hypothetical protein LXL04_020087 [Taraxacum kok-saghyz]
MVLSLWRLRSRGEETSNVDLKKLYNGMRNFFSLQIHHGGMFTKSRSRRYVDGTVDYFYYVDIDLFSVHELDAMVKELGYVERQGLNYHFLIPELDLDFGLLPLVIDGDVHALSTYVPTTSVVISVYIEHGQTSVTSYFQTINEELLGKHSDVISDGSSEEDSEDGQRIVFDEEPMIDDVHVNMINFTGVVDEDIDLGYFAHATNDMQVHEDSEDEPLEVLDNDLFESIASSLTPTVKAIIEANKKDASQLRCIFNGADKYQVTGQWMDQYVVNLKDRTCTCSNWDITGIPCKHAIAAMYDKMQNGSDCGDPEDWVHKCYWLSTWNAMYQYTIDPINGKNMWPRSSCPTTLLPPKHHKQVGRPKKKRKRAVDEPRQSTSLSRK